MDKDALLKELYNFVWDLINFSETNAELKFPSNKILEKYAYKYGVESCMSSLLNIFSKHGYENEV
jgi:hypothetical protein